MQKLNVYKVTEAADQEGRSTQVVGYFSHIEDAHKVSRDSYGGSCSSVTITVFDSLQEFVLFKNDEIRQSALSKLSAEEQKVLGLR